jgi:hypothetical protein
VGMDKETCFANLVFLVFSLKHAGILLGSRDPEASFLPKLL